MTLGPNVRPHTVRRQPMPKYKIRATKVTFMEAKDEDEARAVYDSDNVDIDDWEFYDEQVYEVTADA